MPVTVSVRITMVLLVQCLVWVSHSQQNLNKNLIEFAVLADVHFQDVYGTLSDSDYLGIPIPESGEYAHIRTMASQLRSTRIFNENYFAFRAALDDIVDRNIKLVIMPGDFSDDGQPMHIRGLRQVLDEYTQNHGLSFFLITGNHDIVHPFVHPDGKVDFLGPDGREVGIVSDSTLLHSYNQTGIRTVIAADLQNLGYAEIAEQLSDFGFCPTKSNRYWATPFSTYSYSEYAYEKARLEANLDNRSYVQPPNHIPLPDLSYVVEPVEGIWLLALDANTYLEDGQANTRTQNQPVFRNTGKGLNNLLDHKSYLMDWVAQVVKEANKYNKTLIAFSHYPMVDFNDGASAIMDSLLIGSKMQLGRMPDPEIGKQFADLGLKLHLGGHMHLNDTGTLTTTNGNWLVNIQTPSLAAYPAAYKVITVNSPNNIAVHTIPVLDVPRYAEFFDAYSKEYQHLEASKSAQIWNREVLRATGYSDLMNWHLRELVRLRFLPSEWTAPFIAKFAQLTGSDLFKMAQSIDLASRKDHWDWSGLDLLTDVYRLRSADALAFPDIGESRWAQYQELIEAFSQPQNQSENMDWFQQQVNSVFKLLNVLMHGEPAVNFEINLTTGSLSPITDTIISDN